MIAMAHRWKFRNEEIVSSMVWRCVFFNICEAYKLKSRNGSHYYLFVPCECIDGLKLTEFVAKICKFGFASSINFWIIRKNDSTNKFNVCAWQAISNRSMASMAISTNLHKKHEIGYENYFFNRSMIHFLFISNENSVICYGGHTHEACEQSTTGTISQSIKNANYFRQRRSI